MASLRLALLLFLSITFCESQIVQFGSCVNIETMKYFELERFLGTWYELERLPVWYEDAGLCAYKNIYACGRNIKIEHVFVKNNIQYVLQINTTYAPGDEAVFEIKQSNVDQIGIPLQVITTDYTNYAVVYGCKYYSDMDVKYPWILARNTTLPEEILNQAYHELSGIPSISTAYLQIVDHSEASCEHNWTAQVVAINNDDDDENKGEDK